MWYAVIGSSEWNFPRQRWWFWRENFKDNVAESGSSISQKSWWSWSLYLTFFSRPVSVLRNFPLVTERVFHHIPPIFDPKTTLKCYIPRCHIDPEIENNTTVFWKSGFLFTSISIKQVWNQATVNESSISSDHRDLIFISHAANSYFKPTFCECRIILNSRSILSVPFWSLHENYFAWALHCFCKLQNLLSFKTDQFLWNMALFDSLNHCVEKLDPPPKWRSPLLVNTHTLLTRPINLSRWNVCVFCDCWFNQPRLSLSMSNCFNPHKLQGWCH